MNIKNLKKLKIPDAPGVYFFMKGKEMVYIGKATSLKGRVKSYFGKDLISTRGPLLVDMVFNSENVKWEKTDSVLEALILEASLIKKYQPKYNTKEKDDKSFNYVVITKEKLPRVIVVRGKDLIIEREKRFFQVLGSLGPSPSQTIQKPFFSFDKFGPYTNGGQLREALKILRRIFPFLDDKSKNSYTFYRQVDLVPDVSTTEGVDKYKKDIKYLKLFLSGKKKDVIRNLKKDMMTKAKEREFEQAGGIKRQLFALKHINDTALIKRSTFEYSSVKSFRIESYDIAHMSGKNMVGVMTVIENSNVSKNEYRKFKIRTQLGSNDVGALKEVLTRRFTHKEWAMPDLVVVDGGVAQIKATKNVLKSIGIESSVVSVVKDERHKPKALLGDSEYAKKYKSEILLANSEAHRFAIEYHKNMRGKNFLNVKNK